MRRLGLGEVGEVSFTTEESGSTMASVYYRDFSGRRRRAKRTGRSKADARRRVMRAVEHALKTGRDGEFTDRNTLADGARGWLAMFEDRVERRSRSPSTLDLYRDAVERHVIPGVGGLRPGEVTAPRLDRFVQAVLAQKGYATAKLCRSVLSGMFGWLVRQGGLAANPVRDLTPFELDWDRTARSLTVAEVRDWLAILDGSDFALRWDLPELARFILAPGLRLARRLGFSGVTSTWTGGVVSVERTVIRGKGEGLRASRLKSRTSYRVLALPEWRLGMLRTWRVRLSAFDGPVFPDAKGGLRDRNNVGSAFRRVRANTDIDWVKPHTYRRTVATILDESEASARMIADQLGHSRVS